MFFVLVFVFDVGKLLTWLIKYYLFQGLPTNAARGLEFKNSEKEGSKLTHTSKDEPLSLLSQGLHLSLFIYLVIIVQNTSICLTVETW